MASREEKIILKTKDVFLFDSNVHFNSKGKPTHLPNKEVGGGCIAQRQNTYSAWISPQDHTYLQNVDTSVLYGSAVKVKIEELQHLGKLTKQFIV